jgi:hypothetical protein
MTSVVRPLRPGQKVTVIKSGAVGKVVDIKDTKVGQFAVCNFGTPKEPMLRSVRPSKLARV